MLDGESRRLESSSDDHNGGTEDNHALATKRVSDEDSDDGTKEAAKVVRGDGNTLVGRAHTLDVGEKAGLFGVDRRELGLEGRQSENTASDTLVWMRMLS